MKHDDAIYVYKGQETYYCPDPRCWGVADLLTQRSWRPKNIKGHAPDDPAVYTIKYYDLELVEEKKIIRCRLCLRERDYDKCTKRVIE